MKVVILSVLLLALFLVPSLFSQNRFEPSLKVPGIGIRQKNLSADLLQERERGIVDAMKFYIATQPKFVEDIERVTSDKLQNVFAIASSNSGIPAVWLEALALVESGGKNDAKSPTRPVGLYQFTVAAALEEGLVRKEWVVRQRRQTVGKGKNKRTVIRLTKALEITRDLRKDLQASANAAASRLARMQRMYGGKLDWAIESHHSGPGNILKWVKAYLGQSLTEAQVGDVIRARDLSYPKMFFSCSPAWNERLYQAFQGRMNSKGDYSPTYYFRIQAGLELLNWYRMDKRGFEGFVKRNKNKYKPNEAAPSRMYAMLDHEDFFLKTFNDLKRVQGKEVARVPDQPRLFGYYLRRTGLHPIGEADLVNQNEYLYLRPASIGLLMTVAYEYRQMYAEYRRQHAEKPPFLDLDVSSLVRTFETQENLKWEIGNATARTGWPTHTTAWAFDLAAKYMTNGQKECLEFVLQGLEWMGKVGFIEEKFSSVAYHILPTPHGRDFFTQVYEDSQVHLARYQELEIPRGTEFGSPKAKKVRNTAMGKTILTKTKPVGSRKKAITRQKSARPKVRVETKKPHKPSARRRGRE